MVIKEIKSKKNRVAFYFGKADEKIWTIRRNPIL